MEVLLLKDVGQLGSAGEVKRVADGYARNYLFPRGWATVATPGAIKQAKLEREAELKRQAKALGEAQTLAEQLDGMIVTFQARAGEQDRLYGSLKDLGSHAVTLRLAPEAQAKITVVIEREE